MPEVSKHSSAQYKVDRQKWEENWERIEKERKEKEKLCPQSTQKT